MHFTQATDYAFRIVLHLAAKPPGTIVSGQEIAKQEQVPVQFLRKVMRFLNRAGIVRSHRGVEGGFVLNRQPEEVSLLQVIEAMEGPVELSRCLVSEEGCKIGCSRVCPVHEALQGVQATLLDSLHEIEFASLAARRREFQKKERQEGES